MDHEERSSSYKRALDVTWCLLGLLCVKVGGDFMRPDERGIARP
ncbi:MAG: hypothetical protein WA364_08890 [Candidatus Nitrosopolaris sp.]